jgi:hypothetical protein
MGKEVDLLKSSLSLELMKRRLDAIEELIKVLPTRIDDLDAYFKPKNSFAPGLYIREITIPRNTLMVGRIHKYAHSSIFLSGSMTLLMADGTFKRVKAPITSIASVGTKRAGFSHEECRWICVFSNPENERDVDKIIRRLTVDTFEEYQQFLGEMNDISDNSSGAIRSIDSI